jgi:hypothetical protein
MKHSCLNISTNTDTPAPLLYQCVQTHNTLVFCLLFRPFPRLRFNLFVISETPATKMGPLYSRNTLERKQEAFLYEYHLHWALCRQKTHIKTCSSVVQFSSTVAILTAETTSEHVRACLLPWLSWRWTVPLPSDTNIKPTASITAVLLPFVTYLLSLPRMCVCICLHCTCMYLRICSTQVATSCSKLCHLKELCIT